MEHIGSFSNLTKHEFNTILCYEFQVGKVAQQMAGPILVFLKRIRQICQILLKDVLFTLST